MKYTSERNTQVIIGLLKYHGIKKIVASPGANNVSFVASVQSDPFFEIYSCVDERSAAYMACGIAEESGEPVVITCTGATASRNYFSGLTEAYYRHLPILAITYTQPVCNVGHNVPQVIDRSVISNDIAKKSIYVPMVKDLLDEWLCNINVNDGILEVTHNQPGPVHFNVETVQGGTFDVEEIAPVRPVDRILPQQAFPEIQGKVAIFVGAHARWSDDLTKAVDEFCEKYNAVVFCDHTSNYHGRYRISPAVVSVQTAYTSAILNPNIVIHLGDVSGAYFKIFPQMVYRVDTTGVLCDNFKKLRYVFEMEEVVFFRRYNEINSGERNTSYYESCVREVTHISSKIPELPFSNIWVAGKLSRMLPENSVLHLGILNSLRSFNFFDVAPSIMIYCNTGGFGIDGCVSSLIGASLVAPEKLFFGVVGDLAMFYDINVLGNRHIGKNIRLLVINNGIGQEFKNYGHRAAQFGQDTNPYIAAAGHFGNRSDTLLKGYCESLGFEYLTASNKNDALIALKRFTCKEKTNMPMLLEIFTSSVEETEALKMLSSIEANMSGEAKQFIKNLLGDKGVGVIKQIIKK